MSGKRGKGGRLVARHALPAWHKAFVNEHIHTGFRTEYSVAECARSLFALHNETGNVWSHLLGFLLFCVLGVHLYGWVLDGSLTHGGIFFLFMCGNLMCFGASTCYHLLHCSSHALYETTMFFDYVGISVLITASFIPPIYFAFGCHPTLQVVYTSMISILGGAAIVLPFLQQFNDARFYGLRMMMYVLVVASGVIPTVHCLVIMPFSGATPMFRGIGLIFLFYGVGVIFYVTQFPEKWYPGRFDYWGHSHQIWHVFVLLAAVIHFYTCLGLYQRNALRDCDLAFAAVGVA